MNVKLEDLITAAMQLSPEERAQLAAMLVENSVGEVREAAMPYAVSYSKDSLSQELPGMTSVTVALPDDLAKQAQAAGLLSEASLADLIRRALKEQSAGPAGSNAPRPRRRLVRENGRLVVEALPDEPPVTDTQVADALNRMEW